MTKTSVAIAATVLAVSTPMAVNQAIATTDNGSLPNDPNGWLHLCTLLGRAYLVADGSDDKLIQTPTLDDRCDAPRSVRPGTYYVQADKYLDSPCVNDEPQVKQPLGPNGRCHGKVHHGHTSRWEGKLSARPKTALSSTLEAENGIVVNVVPEHTTEVVFHITHANYPECVKPSPRTPERSCASHPITGKEARY